ncbi:MAG: hypothetical protein J6D31_04060 [Clostridia bacterium]|nr:hypothetical protein [Clostridia bacterium]
MTEKIKISVPQKTYELLRKDAKDFRILKPSGEENLNALINNLVMNYYEKFAADDESLRDNVKAALSTIPEKYAKEVFSEVMKAISQREKEEDLGKSVSVAFKPTKASEAVIVYIENVLLKNESISSFYRRLFISYAKKLKNERERIIHKQNYELLSSAIKKGMQVCVSLDNGHVYTEASLYAIAASKDELFNYALFYSEKKNRTIRLAKIKTVSLLTQSAEIPEEAEKMFVRQIAAGAQYPIYSTDNEPVRVQLSAKGKELFEKIYLYRPTPVSIEGDVYVFDCSANQVLYYFERFGSEALILSPKRLGIFMRNYYYYALKKYRTIYGND